MNHEHPFFCFVYTSFHDSLALPLLRYDDTLVIQLVADITNTVSDDSVVYSIAIQGSQNLLTAHEMQKINPLTLDCHVLSTDLNTARIAPAMDIARISLGVGRFANMELPDTVPATNTFSAKHRKTTTAASFFGKDETNDKKTVTMTKNDNPPIETNTVEPRKVKTAKIIEVKKPPKKSIFGNTPISKPIPTKERLPNDKKENTTTKVAGTADDFIGDDDEDEDFLAEEQDRKRRNQIQRKDTEQKERRREEEAMAVRAAIERKQGQEEPINEQPQKSKKRRKRLVEKTTMDANGYLRTETQAIWEEVSDEDEVVVKKVPVKKVPAKNGMKQGSLMGFFGKK